MSQEQYELLTDLIEIEYVNISVQLVDDNESLPDGFLKVFNEGTTAFDDLNLSQYLDTIRWESICEALDAESFVDPRGNYQFTKGLSGGQAMERSDVAGEFNVAAPSKLVGTDAYAGEYSAMSNIARSVGVPYALEEWKHASSRNTWVNDRFIQNVRYFKEVVFNVFPMYTFAMMLVGALLPHCDEKNVHAGEDSDLMVVSKVLEFKGNWVRVSIIGAMRKSIIDMYERLELLRIDGGYVSRFLSDEVTEDYQRKSPQEYFDAVGCQGVYCMQEMSDDGVPGDVLYATLLQRPHVNKAATHVSTYINLVRACHRVRPFSTYEIIMAGLIWGQCNALDIPSWVWQQWLLTELPVSDWHCCLFQQFTNFVVQYLDGIQNSSLTRCQTFAKAVTPIALRVMAFQVLKLVKDLRTTPPPINMDVASLKELQLKFYKALSVKRGRTNIGQLQRGEVIQFFVGIRLVMCADLFNTCLPMYNTISDRNTSIQTVAAIALAFGVSVATAENINCECKRKWEPIAVFNVGDTFITVRAAQARGNASDIIEYIPDVNGGFRVQAVEHFTPRELLSSEEEDGINWFWAKRLATFERHLASKRITKLDVVNTSGGPPPKRMRRLRFGLNPANLQEARSHVFSFDNVPLGIANLNSFVRRVISGMNKAELDVAERCVGRKRMNVLRREVTEDFDLSRHDEVPRNPAQRIRVDEVRLMNVDPILSSDSSVDSTLSQHVPDAAGVVTRRRSRRSDLPMRRPDIPPNPVPVLNVRLSRRVIAPVLYPQVDTTRGVMRPSDVPERRLLTLENISSCLRSRPLSVIDTAIGEFHHLIELLNRSVAYTMNNFPALKVKNFKHHFTSKDEYSISPGGWKPNDNHEQSYDFTLAGRSVLVDSLACWMGGRVKSSPCGNDVSRLVFPSMELARNHLCMCMLLCVRSEYVPSSVGTRLSKMFYDPPLALGRLGIIIPVRKNRKGSMFLKNGNCLCLIVRETSTVLAFIFMKNGQPDIMGRGTESFYVLV